MLAYGFGRDGFLGTRASLMLDVVVVGMVAALAVLGMSIYLVRYRWRYTLHKRLQLSLAGVLLLIIGLFEAEMRLYVWRDRAEPSPYYPTWVMPALTIHLFFSVSTCVLWIVVIAAAWWRFERPARPGRHSASHRLWGRLAAIDLVLTTISGWIFYWLAFAAK